MTKKYLLKYDPDGSPNGWWKVETEGELREGEELTIINRYGTVRKHIYSSSDEIQDVEDWRDLDWTRVILKPDSPFGFVAPDGTFYGCNIGSHSDLAELVLKIDNPEEYGWVKLFKGEYSELLYYSRRHFLTEEQIDTIDRKREEYRECSVKGKGEKSQER